MKLNNIDLPMPAIERVCQKWHLTELALFGSVLRDDFQSENSDIDVMVQFHPDALTALRGFDYFIALEAIQEELKALFHRDVDVIVRSGIEQSHNYLRRHEILSTAQVIYESSDTSSRSSRST
ncbi:MAG: nucleotidyltransferase domain-containing protein [Cyanobacteria bacterium P01_A01_bin.116]